jgi:hypothetical protein
MLSLSSIAFSQVTVLDSKGDTTICFTIPQAKFLLKEHYKIQECDTLKSICEKQLSICDTALEWGRQISKNQMLVIKNKDEQIKLEEYQITKLKESLKGSQKEIRKQKFYKWSAIIVGGVATGYLGYRLLKR